MKRPLIGVSGSHMVDDHGPFAGYHRSYVNDDYIRSVNEAGGVAILVPFTEDEEAAREIMSRVDGLVLSGGHDVYPLLYGEEPCRQSGPVWPARDRFDQLLLAEAEYEVKGFYPNVVFSCGAFLRERIPFGRIPEIVDHALQAVAPIPIRTIADVYAMDRAAREDAENTLRRLTC